MSDDGNHGGPHENEATVPLYTVGVGTARFWLRVGVPVVGRQMIAITTLLFANAMGTYATTLALTGTSVNVVVTIRISKLVSGDVFSDPNLANAIATALLLVLAPFLNSIATGWTGAILPGGLSLEAYQTVLSDGQFQLALLRSIVAAGLARLLASLLIVPAVIAAHLY
ncbi:hypothetical protein [Rhizobium rhizogenes]|uniref:hypothetical protein n=1 Tax=Rhizobium rhizogenes TaxID=359 RepID=UPI00157387D6|nr:hypothetical protein [Rhizobium rhizogenes]